MNYVIRDVSENTYYHVDGKIIYFEDMKEANDFLALFSQYAVERAMSENPIKVIMVQQSLQNTVIEEKPNSGICGYISYTDLKKERGV